MARRASLAQARARQITAELTENPAYKDFFDFAEKYIRVLNKVETSGIAGVRLVPLILNAVQRDLAVRILKKWAEGKPARFVILKARRMGISTVVVAIAVWLLLTNKNRNALIIAHDDQSTRNVFQMAKRMFDHLPTHDLGGDKRGLDLRPAVRLDNRQELWLVHPTDQTIGHDCKFDTACASNVDAGRSLETHVVLGSENAFWDDAETLLGGVLQTVSDTAETLVALESTANGTGGYFYDKFWEAYRGKDRHGRPVYSDWEAVFYPWHEMPYYRRPLPKGLTQEKFLRDVADDALRVMHTEYGLDIEQTFWAYFVWRDKCKSDWSKFKQEYPGKPGEAFAFAASRVFAEPGIVAIEESHGCSPIWRGDIIDASGVDEDVASARLPAWSQMEPRLVENEQETPLWIWKMPEPGQHYVVSTDPASGGSAGDFSAVQILDAETREQVAEYHGKCQPHVLCLISVLLAVAYNEALWSWEVTGMGRAVSTASLQTEYPHIYMRVPMDRVQSERATEEQPGWSTNKATKPAMIMLGQQEFQAGSAIIHSSRLFSEVRSYREMTRKPSGGNSGVRAGDETHRRVVYGAATGTNDDLLMAWLQGLAVVDSGLYAGGAESNFLPHHDTRTVHERLEDEWEEYLEEIHADSAPGRVVGQGW